MMKLLTSGLAALLISAVAPQAPAQPSPDDFNQDPAKARIITDDLERFWIAWDMAAENPDRRREIFQEHYLDSGTPGLHKFLEHRIGDVDQLLAAMGAHPEFYASIRHQVPQAQAAAASVRDALFKLHEIFPEAVFPDVYIVIGRMNSAGTIDMEGLLIGFEMNTLTDDTPVHELGPWHRSVIGRIDALPVIIMHELVHFQQAVHGRLDFEDLLGRSISEGAADFVAERLVGGNVNRHLHDWALPRESELWEEFTEVMHETDMSGWLYDGESATDRPADLGYFMGYRIAQAYYNRIGDSHAAIRGIIEMNDPHEFLQASGYGGKEP